MENNFNFRNQFLQQNLPLVTVGISSYNYSQYIEDALNSVLSQTYKNIELIIIDDFSADNCPQKTERWIEQNNINCIYIQHSKNEGITKTSNEIVRLSKGKYITLFATDDIMLPERIEKQVAILETAGEDYGMCYAYPKFMNEQSAIIDFPLFKKYEKVFEGNVLYDYVNANFRFVAPTALINRNVYKKVGMYDERVLIEDYNFFVRLLARFKIKFCNYPCIIYRIKTDENASPVFTEAKKNNYERYFHDRILSNSEALKFISDKKVKLVLIQKINQYLKSLAAQNSRYFWKMVFYLYKKGYLKISFKLFIIKLAKQFELKSEHKILLNKK
ncbi:MAG: glycosyltransferase family 2 protein [Chitinophagaceae bacterium]